MFHLPEQCLMQLVLNGQLTLHVVLHCYQSAQVSSFLAKLILCNET